MDVERRTTEPFVLSNRLGFQFTLWQQRGGLNNEGAFYMEVQDQGYGRQITVYLDRDDVLDLSNGLAALLNGYHRKDGD